VAPTPQPGLTPTQEVAMHDDQGYEMSPGMATLRERRAPNPLGSANTSARRRRLRRAAPDRLAQPYAYCLWPASSPAAHPCLCAADLTLGENGEGRKGPFHAKEVTQGFSGWPVGFSHRSAPQVSPSPLGSPADCGQCPVGQLDGTRSERLAQEKVPWIICDVERHSLVTVAD
jgi:hypothetical protein